MKRSPVVLILRILGVLFVLAWSCYVVGGYRTTGFGFEMEVIWAQLFMSLIFTAPFCLIVSTGLKWSRKIALFAMVVFLGIGFSEIHAAVQEQVILREYGEHPATNFMIHRWFPYNRDVIWYNAEFEVWMGDD
jgi:hypothetical protein